MASSGAQPLAFGHGGLFRLTTNTRLPLALAATADGYQPVGIKAWIGLASAPGASTASALMPPSVTSKRPSGSLASPLGLRPLPRRGGDSAAGKASLGSPTSFPLAVFSTASLSALSSV